VGNNIASRPCRSSRVHRGRVCSPALRAILRGTSSRNRLGLRARDVCTVAASLVPDAGRSLPSTFSDVAYKVRATGSVAPQSSPHFHETSHASVRKRPQVCYVHHAWRCVDERYREPCGHYGTLDELSSLSVVSGQRPRLSHRGIRSQRLVTPSAKSWENAHGASMNGSWLAVIMFPMRLLRWRVLPILCAAGLGYLVGLFASKLL